MEHQFPLLFPRRGHPARGSVGRMGVVEYKNYKTFFAVIIKEPPPPGKPGDSSWPTGKKSARRRNWC